ncbi:uncharacterized protein TRAVEDRAFT_73150 [Trametes versicolor FP-101664 SS1]|uniref:uncharacterized protein n=1 Tax=Trametes versicolor (strain FP-101664) TaxID=717944 RepID=UPI0004621D86|nr:uncharacterized protein TRAVEDRAFT_73150 [Trametes versicolor FP-101664 SS1]EIW56685.1 hypothetical protein TRAVEDRAFT_73150 [Trametes versicolor FP-101664 SS1]
MPGPRNQKKKKNAQSKKVDKKPPPAPSASQSPSPTPAPATPPPLAAPVHAHHVSDEPLHDTTPPVEHDIHEKYLPIYPQDETDAEPPISSALFKTPFIYDPGDGPRVKDPRAFLASRFAAPPSLDDAMCAEFAEEAVLQMLCTVLPEETALILWYNKSRRTARICPACQRLYRLGDVLPDHLAGDNGEQRNETRSSPFLAREQEFSGLCSPVCFILAAYNYPGAIRSTWGRMAEELDDATWDLLGTPTSSNDLGLGMLLKMTRCHDLGLAQLFFPDLADGTGEEEAGEVSGEDGSEETVREEEEHLQAPQPRRAKEQWEDDMSEMSAVSPGVEVEMMMRLERLQVAEPEGEDGDA